MLIAFQYWCVYHLCARMILKKVHEPQDIIQLERTKKCVLSGYHIIIYAIPSSRTKCVFMVNKVSFARRLRRFVIRKRFLHPSNVSDDRRKCVFARKSDLKQGTPRDYRAHALGQHPRGKKKNYKLCVAWWRWRDTSLDSFPV